MFCLFKNIFGTLCGNTIRYYKEEGIPKESVTEYLMNIANSNFENWRKQNPAESKPFRLC